MGKHFCQCVCLCVRKGCHILADHGTFLSEFSVCVCVLVCTQNPPVIRVQLMDPAKSKRSKVKTHVLLIERTNSKPNRPSIHILLHSDRHNSLFSNHMQYDSCSSILLLHYSRRGYRIFLKGRGVNTFTSTPPLGHCPRDVITLCLENIHKHPPRTLSA